MLSLESYSVPSVTSTSRFVAYSSTIWPSLIDTTPARAHSMVPSAPFILPAIEPGLFWNILPLGGRAGGPCPAELAVERGGAKEHTDHGLDLPDIPARKVAVERGGAGEHTAHGLDLPYIPAREVAVE